VTEQYDWNVWHLTDEFVLYKSGVGDNVLPTVVISVVTQFVRGTVFAMAPMAMGGYSQALRIAIPRKTLVSGRVLSQPMKNVNEARGLRRSPDINEDSMPVSCLQALPFCGRYVLPVVSHFR
jgi:hypothetical protein